MVEQSGENGPMRILLSPLLPLYRSTITHPPQPQLLIHTITTSPSCSFAEAKSKIPISSIPPPLLYHHRRRRRRHRHFRNRLNRRFYL